MSERESPSTADQAWVEGYLGGLFAASLFFAYMRVLAPLRPRRRGHRF
jgi:hypothetical protein